MTKPGRDLDYTVADVLERLNLHNPTAPVPRYSTDISAAWFLAEILHDNWYALAIIRLKDKTLGKVYKMPAMEEYVKVEGVTAPHAICLAALKILGER